MPFFSESLYAILLGGSGDLSRSLCFVSGWRQDDVRVGSVRMALFSEWETKCETEWET